MSRDDFPIKVKDNLAKRAGFLCSNPDCKKVTVGSNENENKSTLIGVAAHITAASEGGPRYDNSLTSEERGSIDNGIWLCGNCATLIDRDPAKYSEDLLRGWKQLAEIESAARLLGKKLVNNKDLLYLEADLVHTSGSILPGGISKKNPLQTDHEGNFYYDVSDKPIINWTLIWKYNFIVYNQSNLPLFNIMLESVGDTHFTYFEEIPKVNNLPSLEKIVLKAKYEEYFEGTGIEANIIHKPLIPDKFTSIQIRMSYLDSNGDKYFTLVTFQNNRINNSRITDFQ